MEECTSPRDLEAVKMLDLPQFKTIPAQSLVKVLRHRDSTRDLWEECRNGEFDKYQNVQGWDVFGAADYIVSFIAEQNKFAKFVGVWKVLSKRKRTGKGFTYRTEEIGGFEDLKGRLIVRWGDGARSWAQRLDKEGNKDVSEILPRNYVKGFPGFYEFTLTYPELVTITGNPDAHREWERMLSSAAGVYLVLDESSGHQYVGSAYGQGGIWARWKRYAKSPTGGNVQLQKLLQNKPGRHMHFRYSILRVLEPSSTKREVIAQEALTKKKLGTRAFGLNCN